MSVEKSGSTFPAYEVYQDLNGDSSSLGTFQATEPGALFDEPIGWIARQLS